MLKPHFFHSKHSEEPISNPQQIQELIDKYETRIEELLNECNIETDRANKTFIDYQNLLNQQKDSQTDDEKQSYEELEAKWKQLDLSYNCLCDENKKLKKENASLIKQRDNATAGKEDRRAMAAALTQYKLMAEYAKSQGFKFLKLDKMKEAIEASKMQEAEPVIPAVKEPLKIDFEAHTNCPNSMHNQRGNTIEVASSDCKRCPFCKSINYDEKYVECNLNK